MHKQGLATIMLTLVFTVTGGLSGQLLLASNYSWHQYPAAIFNAKFLGALLGMYESDERFLKLHTAK